MRRAEIKSNANPTGREKLEQFKKFMDLDIEIKNSVEGSRTMYTIVLPDDISSEHKKIWNNSMLRSKTIVKEKYTNLKGDLITKNQNDLYVWTINSIFEIDYYFIYKIQLDCLLHCIDTHHEGIIRLC